MGPAINAIVNTNFIVVRICVIVFSSVLLYR